MARKLCIKCLLLLLLLLLSHLGHVWLCDPIDSSPPGSPVPGILQARTLEWVAISFSNAWKWKVKVKLLSHVRLLATPWTAACQAPLSMGFSKQEYWSGVPLPALIKCLIPNPVFLCIFMFILFWTFWTKIFCLFSTHSVTEQTHRFFRSCLQSKWIMEFVPKGGNRENWYLWGT